MKVVKFWTELKVSKGESGEARKRYETTRFLVKLKFSSIDHW